MRARVTAIVVALFLVLPVALVDAEPVYPDFSKSTCEVAWDSTGYKIIVRGIELLGYGLWISNYWNPNTLSFDFLPNAQFGIEHFPGGGSPKCSFIYTDLSGNRVKVFVTTVDSGSIRLDAELLDGSLWLCLNNSHVFITSNVTNYISGSSQAGGNWGGCGHLVPGNTYSGLILRDFYENNNPGSRPDLTKPFTFNYMDESWRSFSVLCQ